MRALSFVFLAGLVRPWLDSDALNKHPGWLTGVKRICC